MIQFDQANQQGQKPINETIWHKSDRIQANNTAGIKRDRNPMDSKTEG